MRDIQTIEYVFGAARGALLIVGIAYVFYESWLALIPMLPLSVFYMWEWLSDCSHKKEIEFRGQFKDSIEIMSTSLKAGYSVENAIRETSKELQSLYRPDSRIVREYSQMVYKLSLNITVETVLEEFSENVQQEDVYNFVTVFSAAKKSGGDSISLIRDAVKIISGKIETEREIETLLASKKLEFHIMCLIPFGVICYLKVTFREFLSVLYGNITGVVVMSICLFVYLLAYRMGRKIIQIEV